MSEIWKDIEGYEGLYQVSNLGRVKSLPRYWVKEERILTPKGCPYPRVCLHRDKIKTYFGVHNLVATAYVPNPHNYPIVDHIDGNPKNNVWTNLRWTDFKGNSNNPIAIKRMSNAMKGNQNGNKTILMYDTEYHLLNEFSSMKKAAQYMGKTDPHQISHCCKKKQETAYGYIWRYKKDAC